MNIAGRDINLYQLTTELQDAGFITGGLGTVGDDLFAYNAEGEPIDIPEGAYTVVETHIPENLPTKRDILRDILDSIDTSDAGNDATEIMLIVQREMLTL